MRNCTDGAVNSDTPGRAPPGCPRFAALFRKGLVVVGREMKSQTRRSGGGKRAAGGAGLGVGGAERLALSGESGAAS